MKPSNFTFLEEEFPLLFNLGQSAEYNLHQDPVTSLMKLRQFAEQLTILIYEAEVQSLTTKVGKLKQQSEIPFDLMAD